MSNDKSGAASTKISKLMAGSVVTGIVAVFAIAGVLARSDNTPASNAKDTTTVQDTQKDEKQTSEQRQDAATATNAPATDVIAAVLGSSTDIPNTNTAPVQTASATPQPAVNSPVTPANPTPSMPNQPTEPVNPAPSPQPIPQPTPQPNPNPAKFDKARVSLTFDDGWKSIHDNALPLLQKYGLASTQYVYAQPIVGATSEGWTGYMNAQDVADFAAAGHEIAWHTNTHQYDLTTVDTATMNGELVPASDFISLLTSVNVTLSDNFAAPYGTQNPATATAAKANGFNSYRTTYDGYNTKGDTDVMRVKVKNVCGIGGLDACNMQATTPEEIADWIAEAQTNNAWLVIVFHEVAEFTRQAAKLNGTTCDADLSEAGVDPTACVIDPSYAITPANLDAALSTIKASGIAVQTVDQALEELSAQL